MRLDWRVRKRPTIAALEVLDRLRAQCLKAWMMCRVRCALVNSASASSQRSLGAIDSAIRGPAAA